MEPPHPGQVWVAWLSTFTTNVWFSLALIFLPLLFPDGRLPSPRWRPVLWLGVASMALGAIGTAIAPGALELRQSSGIDNPLGVEGGLSDAANTASLVLGALAIVLAAASVVVRLRRARGGGAPAAQVVRVRRRPRGDVSHAGHHQLGLRRVERRFHRGGGDGLAQRARTHRLRPAGRHRDRDPAPPPLRRRPGDPAHAGLRRADRHARRDLPRARAARRARGGEVERRRSRSRRSRSRRCSARRSGASRRSWTAASTAAATTRR